MSDSPVTRISIIVPVLDEAIALAARRPELETFLARGHEVIVVDGGSTDASAAVAADAGCRVVRAPRGRASQMNAGAAAAAGRMLLFLHADTRLPPAALDAVEDQYRRRGEDLWGRFDVSLAGSHWLYRLIERGMNARSRLTGIATGDQAIFVGRALFATAGGFPAVPLMEDVALSKRLRRLASPVCLRARVVTSTRRWDRDGIVATMLLMWRLRLAYALGADPARLARRYDRFSSDAGQ